MGRNRLKSLIWVVAAAAGLCSVFSCGGPRTPSLVCEAASATANEIAFVGAADDASRVPQLFAASHASEASDCGTEAAGADHGLIHHSAVMAILLPYDTVRAHNRYERHLDSMPPAGVKLRINYLGAPLARVFNDSNKVQIAAAEQIGIAPMHTLRDAWDNAQRLERLSSCEEYYLDNLTHSIPYLVPRAHRLLKDIGAAFRDSLQARGGGAYRVKVTSVLRTPSLVRQLRRRNRNAVDTSAHLYGTTFDISHINFICDSLTVARTQEDLKNLLGEVIENERRNGRCYVKYERKQSCYHVTAR